MSDDFVYGDSPVSYAVEYLCKGASRWRRTMLQPLDFLGVQQDVLMENKTIAATRMVAITERVRLLTEEELAVARRDPPNA